MNFMHLKKTFALAAAAAVASAAAVSGSFAKGYRSETKSDKMRYEDSMREIPHATLGFDEGSSALTSGHKEELRKVVREARKIGGIRKIMVAAWSDKALPQENQRLNDTDRELAAKRAEAISDFVSLELGVAKVDAYNMAESSNRLASLFHAKDAELKSIFTRKGAEAPPVTNAELQMIKSEGGPSSAVVVLERKAAYKYSNDDEMDD